MQSFITEKQSITTWYNAKKKNMIIYEISPRNGNGTQDRYSWRGNTRGSCGLEFVSTKSGSSRELLQTQKSGEMQDKGFHTSCHPILRPNDFCYFSLYFKKIKKGRDSSIPWKTKVIRSSACPQNTNTQKQGKDGTLSQAAL